MRLYYAARSPMQQVQTFAIFLPLSLSQAMLTWASFAFPSTQAIRTIAWCKWRKWFRWCEIFWVPESCRSKASNPSPLPMAGFSDCDRWEVPKKQFKLRLQNVFRPFFSVTVWPSWKRAQVFRSHRGNPWARACEGKRTLRKKNRDRNVCTSSIWGMLLVYLQCMQVWNQSLIATSLGSIGRSWYDSLVHKTQSANDTVASRSKGRILETFWSEVSWDFIFFMIQHPHP